MIHKKNESYKRKFPAIFSFCFFIRSVNNFSVRFTSGKIQKKYCLLFLSLFFYPLVVYIFVLIKFLIMETFFSIVELFYLLPISVVRTRRRLKKRVTFVKYFFLVRFLFRQFFIVKYALYPN